MFCVCLSIFPLLSHDHAEVIYIFTPLPPQKNPDAVQVHSAVDTVTPAEVINLVFQFTPSQPLRLYQGERLCGPGRRCSKLPPAALLHNSAQLKMVSMRSKMSICAPHPLSKVSPTFPLKRLTMAVSRPLKEDRLALPLSTPLSSRRSMV